MRIDHALRVQSRVRFDGDQWSLASVKTGMVLYRGRMDGVNGVRVETIEEIETLYPRDYGVPVAVEIRRRISDEHSRPGLKEDIVFLVESAAKRSKR